MRQELEYTDTGLYIRIYDGDKMVAEFWAELDHGEYRFKVQTPFTGHTTIHTVDCYEN